MWKVTQIASLYPSHTQRRRWHLKLIHPFLETTFFNLPTPTTMASSNGNYLGWGRPPTPPRFTLDYVVLGPKDLKQSMNPSTSSIILLPLPTYHLLFTHTYNYPQTLFTPWVIMGNF